MRRVVDARASFIHQNTEDFVLNVNLPWLELLTPYGPTCVVLVSTTLLSALKVNFYRGKTLFSKETIGTALYLGPSVMDHSCSPNASVSFDGIDIVVRSLTDREELDFSATFIRDSDK